QGGSLTIYLDRYGDNEPVDDAAIDVRLDGHSLTASALQNGIYRLRADWLKQPGRHDLSFAIAAEQGTETLAGSLEVPAVVMAPPVAGATGPAPLLSFGNLLAFLLGVVATLALRHAAALAALARA